MSEKIDEKVVMSALADIAPRAAMGLMAEGLLHNLSGVAQAISMQVDLLAMAFAALNDEGDSSSGSPEQAMIRDKGVVVERLVGKSEEMQRLLHNAAGFIFSEPGSIPVIIDKLIADELELASCDMFFKHKVEKELNIGQGLPLIRGQRHELQMIIHQLLRNSIESLAAGNVPQPRIAIRASFENGLVNIEITDNGIAEPLDREEIFKPFFTTREGHGGLGLWLARHLAGRNRGSLSCSRLGKDGAAFIIELPAGERE